MKKKYFERRVANARYNFNLICHSTEERKRKQRRRGLTPVLYCIVNTIMFSINAQNLSIRALLPYRVPFSAWHTVESRSVERNIENKEFQTVFRQLLFFLSPSGCCGTYP